MDVASLTSRIVQLEKELSEQKHVCVEIAQSAEAHVKELEAKLVDANAAICKEKELNMMIAKSADDHVNELIQQIALLSKDGITVSGQDIGNSFTAESTVGIAVPTSGKSTVISSNIQRSPSLMDKYVNNQSTQVIMSGYLSKRSPTFPFTLSIGQGGWQSRFFILTKEGLMPYWIKEDDYKFNWPSKGVLRPVDILHQDRLAMRPRGEGKSILLYIKGFCYELEAESKDVANQWFVSILSTYS